MDNSGFRTKSGYYIYSFEENYENQFPILLQATHIGKYGDSQVKFRK